jgi:hypothetical protein
MVSLIIIWFQLTRQMASVIDACRILCLFDFVVYGIPICCEFEWLKGSVRRFIWRVLGARGSVTADRDGTI